MTSSTIKQPTFRIPTITQVDLQTFQARFFGADPAGTGPQTTPRQTFDEPEDGLGYYPDGVKRTLTDEQVAMFRHSEIQAILRKRRHEKESSDSPQHRRVDADAAGAGHDTDFEHDSPSAADDDDEYARFLEQEQMQLTNEIAGKKRKRSANVDETGYHNIEDDREVAKDLDGGSVPYDGLNYGDDTGVSNPRSQVIDEQRTELEHGRRRIVYENEEDVDTVISTAGGTASGISSKAKIFLWPKIHI